MVNSHPPKPASKDKQTLLPLLAVLILCLLSFAPVLKNGFVNFDDPSILLKNPAAHALNMANIKHIFTSLSYYKIYVPLTILSFAVEHHFFQLNPFIYHLDNLVLHLGVTALVFVFALQVGLPVRGASLAALLFGIHPMHVESVAWITERKDVFYSFFYMLALCFYWQYLSQKKLFPYCAAIAFGLLSILAKPMALSLPLVLLACDWLKGRGIGRIMVFDKIPYLVYVTLIARITFGAQPRVPGEIFQSEFLVWIYTITFYIRQFFLPLTLSPLYMLPEPIALTNPHYLNSALLLAMIAAFFIRMRHNRWVFFAVSFFFLSVFFLVRHNTGADRSFVSDRFMYLPSLGFCLLFGVAADRVLSYCKTKALFIRAASPACFALLFVYLSFNTFGQTKIWKNSQTLWSYVITVYPGAAIAYNNRGASQTRLDLAIKDYDQTLRLDPEFPEAYFNRGNAYYQTGEYSRAIADYTRYISLDPYDGEAYFNRSLAYKKIGKPGRAAEDEKRGRALGYVE